MNCADLQMLSTLNSMFEKKGLCLLFAGWYTATEIILFNKTLQIGLVLLNIWIDWHPYSLRKTGPLLLMTQLGTFWAKPIYKKRKGGYSKIIFSSWPLQGYSFKKYFLGLVTMRKMNSEAMFPPLWLEIPFGSFEEFSSCR